MTERRNLRHEPALDGLRGLAVAAVLLYHLGQVDNLGPLRNFAKGGYLGVSAFFTLSGFLITSSSWSSRVSAISASVASGVAGSDA